MSANYWVTDYWAIPSYWNEDYWALEITEETNPIRHLIFGINPKTQETTVYTLSGMLDLNTSGAGSTCAYTPVTKGSNINLMQDSTYIGTINTGAMYRSFSERLIQDGEDSIVGELVFKRLDPAMDVGGGVQGLSTKKRFLKILFDQDNPLDIGASIYYAIDVDPEFDSVVWKLAKQGDARSVYLENAIGTWISLRIVDSSGTVGVPMLGAFTLEYYAIGNI